MKPDNRQKEGINMSSGGFTGESEYYKRMRLAAEKRFDEAKHKADFEKRFRPLIEGGLTEKEFIKGDDRAYGDSIEDFRELKEEMERERELDEAFLRGFQSVKGPYQRYEQVVKEDTAGGTD